MIEQIEENYFEEFDRAEGQDRIKVMDRLIIQYAHKIRELVNEVNTIGKYLENKSKK